MSALEMVAPGFALLLRADVAVPVVAQVAAVLLLCAVSAYMDARARIKASLPQRVVAVALAVAECARLMGGTSALFAGVVASALPELPDAPLLLLPIAASRLHGLATAGGGRTVSVGEWLLIADLACAYCRLTWRGLVGACACTCACVFAGSPPTLWVVPALVRALRLTGGGGLPARVCAIAVGLCAAHDAGLALALLGAHALLRWLGVVAVVSAARG